MGKIIGLVVVTVFLIGGFLYWNSQNSPEAMEDTPEGTVATEETVSGVMMEEKGMVSSIKEAMGLGQKMQCTYAMNEGKESVESTVTIDGSKFKSVTVMENMTVYALFDGENQYSWTSESQTGMQMSKTCLEKMQDSVKDMTNPTETAATTPQNMEKAFEMAKNVKCEPASDSDFALPKDVIFTDQCAVLEQSLKLMEGMKDTLPAGMIVPGMPTVQ